MDGLVGPHSTESDTTESRSLSILFFLAAVCHFVNLQKGSVAIRPVGTVHKIFDFGARRLRCAAPPLKNRHLSPFGAKFTRGRSIKGAYEMFDFGAQRAPRTVPTHLVAIHHEKEHKNL
jgi:hypothetical protein